MKHKKLVLRGESIRSMVAVTAIVTTYSQFCTTFQGHDQSSLRI